MAGRRGCCRRPPQGRQIPAPPRAGQGASAILPAAMGRAGPREDGSTTAAAPRGPYARALRVCLLLVLTAFLVELGFEAAGAPGALGATRVRGLLAGLGLGLTLAA